MATFPVLKEGPNRRVSLVSRYIDNFNAEVGDSTIDFTRIGI